MTGFVGWDDAPAREQIAPERVPGQPELGLFARIEGLLGEEKALLDIPAQRRSGRQHNRLREISAELDRIFERLQERAKRGATRTPSEARPPPPATP
jgi:hypothetical protein